MAGKSANVPTYNVIQRGVSLLGLSLCMTINTHKISITQRVNCYVDTPGLFWVSVG